MLQIKLCITYKHISEIMIQGVFIYSQNTYPMKITD